MKKLLFLKETLWTNLTIKICSLAIGIGIWIIINQSIVYDQTFDANVHFFGTTVKNIQGPETISITLRATRTNFAKITAASPMVHINADTLHEGNNPIIITQEHLFLPQDITMLHCNPRLAEFMVEPKKV